MSGGSFEYMCFKGADELVQFEEQLERMTNYLAGRGDAEDAARETQEVLLLIRQYKVRIEARAKRLHEIWRTVEWHISGDYSEGQVKEALARYRDEKVTKNGA